MEITQNRVNSIHSRNLHDIFCQKINATLMWSDSIKFPIFLNESIPTTNRTVTNSCYNTVILCDRRYIDAVLKLCLKSAFRQLSARWRFQVIFIFMILIRAINRRRKSEPHEAGFWSAIHSVPCETARLLQHYVHPPYAFFKSKH